MVRTTRMGSSRSLRSIAVRRLAGLVQPARARGLARGILAGTLVWASLGAVAARGGDADRLKELQAAYVAAAGQKMMRAYHSGSQGSGDVFSNYTSHTNRLVPVYLFGSKADLGAVMGTNSRYRDPETIQATY